MQATTDDPVLDERHLCGALDELQPIHALHAQVADHDIDRTDLLQQGQCFGRIRRFEHLSAADTPQHLYGDGTLESMVFHYQHT
ncbi:hypothetical protein D3C80_1303850 [compost metagenome]